MLDLIPKLFFYWLSFWLLSKSFSVPRMFNACLCLVPVFLCHTIEYSGLRPGKYVWRLYWEYSYSTDQCLILRQYICVICHSNIQNES
jgi:hypothetical protein